MTIAERQAFSFSEGNVHETSIEHMQLIEKEIDLVLSLPNVTSINRGELEEERLINQRQLEFALASHMVASTVTAAT